MKKIAISLLALMLVPGGARADLGAAEAVWVGRP